MKPLLPNLEPFFAAGIDPKTGLPVKFTSGDKTKLKENTKKFLRLIDEQDAVNRYVWYNIPANITSQELERMLYYYGQLCLFYNKETEEFMITKYALDGPIDFYGRFKVIHPVPVSAGLDQKDKAAELLSTKKLNCVYGVKTEMPSEDELMNSCVLLHDYSKQLSQIIIPRVTVNDPILDVMAECIPMARTARLLGTGVRGVKVQNEDEAHNVFEANEVIENGALEGDGLVPITASVDMQELTGMTPSKSEEYMLAMQSLDNLRLSGYGIDNGGLFEKKAHELQTEADINGGPVGLVLQDGLSIRQNFCNIVNSIWGIGIWCEPAENIMGADLNGDGQINDENRDGSHSGIDKEGENENE